MGVVREGEQAVHVIEMPARLDRHETLYQDTIGIGDSTILDFGSTIHTHVFTFVVHKVAGVHVYLRFEKACMFQSPQSLTGQLSITSAQGDISKLTASGRLPGNNCHVWFCVVMAALTRSA